MSLKDVYANDNKDSKYISLKSGDSVEGKLIDAESTTGNFGPQVNYTIEVGGVEKTLSSGSKRLLRGIRSAGIEEGDYLRISAEGEGLERTYEVEKIDESD